MSEPNEDTTTTTAIDTTEMTETEESTIPMATGPSDTMTEKNENVPKKENVSLTFSNYTDLQTRLLLFPLNDEESKGAVISSYSTKISNIGSSLESTASESDKDEMKDDSSKNESEQKNDKSKEKSEGDEANEVSDSRDGENLIQAEVESKERVGEEANNENSSIEKDDNVFEHKKTEGYPVSSPTNNDRVMMDQVDDGEEKKSEQDAQETSEIASEEHSNLVGYILNGINGVEEIDDWASCDFSDILAYCRTAPTPIVMSFSTPSSTSNPSSENFDDSNKTPKGTDESSTASEITHRLSRWGSRMRSTTSLLAAETASRVQSVAGSAAEAAVKAKDNAAKAAAEAAKQRRKALELSREIANSSSTSTTNTNDSSSNNISEELVCSLFVQSSNGSLVQVVPTPSKKLKKSIPTITNSSLLLCRQSEESSLSTTYTCQWYRLNPNSSSSSNSDVNSSVHSANSSWILIKDANSSAFQPSFTEIGHQIKCVVSIDSTPISSCQIDFVVQADSSLFNAARQNVGEMGGGRGAKFGNLKGRGNAEGRTFQAKIEITTITTQVNTTAADPATTLSSPRNSSTTKNKSSPIKKQKQIVSKLSLFQVSGSVAEPLHDHDAEPIYNCSARSSHVDPKAFELVFHSPPANSLLSALAVNNCLQLSAPNRISRESMLLSLGIANYRGKPSALNPSSILFIDDESLLSSSSSSLDIEEKILASSASSSSLEEEDSVGERSNESTGGITHFSGDNNNINGTQLYQSQITSLENDLMRMAKKLAAKDKVISELQRKLSSSDAQVIQAESELDKMKQVVNKAETDYKTCHANLRLAEKRQETHETVLARVKGDYTTRFTDLEQQILSFEERAQEYEKSMKALENEKAVMSAGIEARDSKLLKMSELRQTITALMSEVEKGEVAKKEVKDLTAQNELLQEQLLKKEEIMKKQLHEISNTQTQITSLRSKLDTSEEHYSTINAKLLDTQSQNQKLKTERNKYKQKADSLSKEMSRVCRNGLNINKIEEIIENQESMESEIAILKAGKQQALKELEECRIDYGTLVRAHDMAGKDYDTARILEQRAELEKVVESLTEYVQAKEMQIETMKEVTKSLMDELSSQREFTM